MYFISSCLVLAIGFFAIGADQVEAQTCIGSSSHTVSPLTEEKQVFTDWCTAAAVRVATTHYGITLSQCELVGLTVGSTCCPLKDHTPGNDPTCHPAGIWPHEILNKANFTYTSYVYGPALPWNTIKTEICSNRPIVSVAKAIIQGAPLHSVVVEGFHVDVDNLGELHKVRVFDPQEDVCDLLCTTEADQNPRFILEEAFKNQFEHDRDYINIIGPRGDTAAPAAPLGLTVK